MSRRRSRFHPAPALVAALAVALAPLVPRVAAAAAPAVPADGAGTAVAQPARRIVSLAPHLTELVFSAGAGDRLVGVDAWSDFPGAARTLPRVGDSAQLDLERVVSLRPDLVLVWADGTPARQLQRLQAMGLPVLPLRIERLEDVAAVLRRLGAAAGTQATADAAANRFDQDLQALRARYAGRRELKVFYQVWQRPLMTVSGRHFISQALAVCGARNVFAALAPLTPTVGEEAVVAADPDAIAASRQDGGGADPLARWRALPALRATRAGALLLLDADTLHRPTDRLLQGIGELCTRLDEVRQKAPR